MVVTLAQERSATASENLKLEFSDAEKQAIIGRKGGML